jgi:hypothetical protein
VVQAGYDPIGNATVFRDVGHVAATLDKPRRRMRRSGKRTTSMQHERKHANGEGDDHDGLHDLRARRPVDAYGPPDEQASADRDAGTGP